MATTSEVSALDWAFLCLEQESAPMHVGAVAVFRPPEPVDRVGLAGLLAKRAQRIARLRLRIGQSWLPGQAHWAEASGFDAAEHVHSHQVPSPGGREELADLVAELVAEPLDRRRPLWELHLITGLDGDRFAILVKFHHALADGRDAVELGVGLLDGFAPGTQEPLPERGGSPLNLLRRPQQVISTMRETLSKSGESLGIASSVLRNMRMPVTDSPLRAAPSAARRVALIPIDLADLRRIRVRHGGTTNDVVLAVLAGAFRRWLAARGYPAGEMPVRALIPVCRRRGTASGNNQLSGYLCDLPVGEANPVARLQAVRDEMGRNKSAGPLRGPGAFPVLAGRVPQIVHQVATPLAGQGAALLFDTVITNVPLPAFRAELDGAALDEFYPVAPLAAGHALVIAVSQYRDKVHVGVQANRTALPDLEKLSEALPLAVAELDDRS